MEQNEIQYEECRECDGRGRWSDPSHGSRPCYKCDQTGKVPVKTPPIENLKINQPLHPKVAMFAQAMQHELDANKQKGDWQEWKDVPDILNELEYHKAKLLFALKEGDKEKAKEHIADCANILMALGNAGYLYELT